MQIGKISSISREFPVTLKAQLDGRVVIGFVAGAEVARGGEPLNDDPSCVVVRLSALPPKANSYTIRFADQSGEEVARAITLSAADMDALSRQAEFSFGECLYDPPYVRVSFSSDIGFPPETEFRLSSHGDQLASARADATEDLCFELSFLVDRIPRPDEQLEVFWPYSHVPLHCMAPSSASINDGIRAALSGNIAETAFLNRQISQLFKRLDHMQATVDNLLEAGKAEAIYRLMLDQLDGSFKQISSSRPVLPLSGYSERVVHSIDLDGAGFYENEVHGGVEWCWFSREVVIMLRNHAPDLKAIRFEFAFMPTQMSDADMRVRVDGESVSIDYSISDARPTIEICLPTRSTSRRLKTTLITIDFSKHFSVEGDVRRLTLPFTRFLLIGEDQVK